MATKSYKIVFLIDHSLKNDDRKSLRSIDDLINIVRVCVLKILTYFGSERYLTGSGKSSQFCNLEWDVTYFRCTSRRFRDKPRFREFTLKDFEAFETELETRFQILKATIEGSLQQNDSVCGVNDVESDVLDALKHALRALVHDYSWDRPDMMSPVKVSRSNTTDRRKLRRTCPNESADVKQNFAFVVAECPRNAADLDIITPDSSAVLQLFLPNDFRRQFVDSSGIRLFWIDVGSRAESVSSNYEGVLTFSQNTLFVICF